ncbi:SMP-30/gluconolactonase/LRE family protein [Parapedobacter sp. 10938]|uniref:SMP-30/gluconolactonase/LRE family protein n=1 Tax=Parapedobacter flavus TaxID=3110225 RepID=UPI002DBCF0FB|nr:SMP-30/gluconolactonase/LRE family protein [Parapedobacter sp. 10938]MEC3878456.1 SMP-30/gluconolactonase/LRE family protein [Parapedobacter sp. 10938]
MNSNPEVYRVPVMVSCELGEGPVWDKDQNRLLWVDILRGTVHEWYPGDRRHVSKEFPIKIGAIALTEDGGLVAATRNGFAMLDLQDQSIAPLTDPESKLPNNRFNDGKCDPVGRFWAGTMDEVTGERGAGSLYMLDESGQALTKISNVSCSNGLAWSADQKTMYYIDTPTREVVAFDFDSEAGEISNKRVVFDVPQADGLPDGMTIDAEGMLWVALWGGWKIARWNPKTGEKLTEINLPVSQVTSCAFGGSNLNDLYITSAKVGLSAESLASQPLAGALFVVKNMDVGGMEPFRYVMQDGLRS